MQHMHLMASARYIEHSILSAYVNANLHDA
jgi:hypothetical protein